MVPSLGAARQTDPPIKANFGIAERAEQMTRERSAPSLLPAFEPFHSSSAAATSPRLPRVSRPDSHASLAGKASNHGEQLPIKAQKLQENAKLANYLPSAPTSSTCAPSDSVSPSRHGRSENDANAIARTSSLSRRPPRPVRTVSALGERTPLGPVPAIELDISGRSILMGRSSNSSHYQLSTNKLISRVHVTARFVSGTTTDSSPSSRVSTIDKVVIECTGWNGVKVHCQGRAWDLFKGDTFTSETANVDIMIDVHDARVIVRWPQPQRPIRAITPSDSDEAVDSEASPSFRNRMIPSLNHSVSRSGDHEHLAMQSSPPPLRHRDGLCTSPCPSPSKQAIEVNDHAPATKASAVQIYEDDSVDDDIKHRSTQDPSAMTQLTESTFIASQPLLPPGHNADSQDYLDEDYTASVRENTSTEKTGQCRDDHGIDHVHDHDHFSDNDEENDPIIASFGPTGANLTDRLGSITTSSVSLGLDPTSTAISPRRQRRPLESLSEEAISPQRQACGPPNKRRRTEKENGIEHPTRTNRTDRGMGQEPTQNHKSMADATCHESGKVDGDVPRKDDDSDKKDTRESNDDVSHADLVNFVINHLLYTQLSTTPLSTLLHHMQAHIASYYSASEPNTKNPGVFSYENQAYDDEIGVTTNADEALPKDTKTGKHQNKVRTAMTSSDLAELLSTIPCIGAVQRKGKDAAGKPLESEYYYIPEQDDDELRRTVVRDLGIAGRRGLRECRKSHKQYYWRKPK